MYVTGALFIGTGYQLLAYQSSLFFRIIFAYHKISMRRTPFIGGYLQFVGTVTMGAAALSPVSVSKKSIIKNENVRLESKSVLSIQNQLPS